ncbi:hypothetical protein KP509_38G040000 [Ceratopteris richardii]|uniref:X8 domain-containing protein n=1 Tax=Ceratopteris richardii TaxID=49495 RepID=A0A8T2Q3T7_CERRI|nr:hypothetical protein KP509_38G040000 [Ceratopteris richardii]KAH7278413.1 hypothetical protein KP509_38G040000 [Ceratopteris richardii]KAH7278414.1 hypothetical protein KP509_38G040000 [Ceratopteris richardii]KAH7278415.1 hypothetical protein KP509_38G040000 [Ceratopteris richardii]
MRPATSFRVPFHVAIQFIMTWCFYQSDALGVNWGVQASHPLSPSIVVKLLRSNGISKVKLFDSNSSVLNALKNSGIEVMVGIPNDLLSGLTNPSKAVSWVQNNIIPYMSSNSVDIRYVGVGNEPFLKSYNGSYLDLTYPALENIQSALNAAGYGSKIKATVPMNADVIQSNGPPSTATFRPDISVLMTQIVQFLSQNGAPYTINIYPFISLHDDPNFPVDYAFFDGSENSVVDGAFTYKNVFDASFDSLIASLAAAGPYGNMNVIVGEIGWPTDGDVNANMDYAKKFNQGFINHVLSNTGTPRRPNQPINYYLFSLIDEDQKSIQPGNFERHWGIFEYDGTSKYALSLTGVNGQALIQASGVKYLTTEWCIYNPDGGDQSKLGDSITYACENSDCTALGFGCSCNPHLDAAGNASYAFNQYFQRFDQASGTCAFNGLGQVVTNNPSKGSCEFMIQIAESAAIGSEYSIGCSVAWSRLWQSLALVFAFIFSHPPWLS